jgi:hypothetical protein
MRRTAAGLLLVSLLVGGLAAPRRASAKSLDAAVDEAAAALAAEVPREPGARVAILPLRSAEADRRLAAHAAARAAERLRAAKVDALDAGFAEALLEAERRRPNGPQDATPERLAGTYLRVVAVVAGEIADGEGGPALTLRLVDARSEKALAWVRVPFSRDDAPLAPAPLAPLVFGAGPAVVVERDVFVERSLGEKRFARPERWSGGALKIGDHILLHVRPLADCFLTVIVYQSDGTLRRLYPAKAQATVDDARVNAQDLVKLPQKPGNFWFPLGEPPGTDTYYIVAEREPALTPRLLKLETSLERAPRPPASGGGTETASPPPAPKPAPRKESERMRDIWDEEASRESDVLDELASSARASREEQALRRACRSISAGDPLPEGEKALRKLEEPEPGGSVEIAGSEGTLPLDLGRVEGAVRVVERFAITTAAR